MKTETEPMVDITWKGFSFDNNISIAQDFSVFLNFYEDCKNFASSGGPLKISRRADWGSQVGDSTALKQSDKF